MSSFTDKINEYIITHRLFSTTDILLVAVSGGADSMALLHFLHNSGYKVIVAHCNFKLRKGESDLDQLVVTKYCNKHDIECHVHAFDTQAYLKEQKLSVQSAARELRYRWFEELYHQHHISKVVTAHHLNDNVETIMINQLRGTGIDGLCGIPPKTERLARPFLCVTQKAIRSYVQQHQIPFREDNSNFSDYYLRNYIRLHIIPSLTDRNNSFLETMNSNITHFNSVRSFADRKASELFEKMLTTVGKKMIVPIQSLQSFGQGVDYLLYYWLQNYKFHSRQIPDIVASFQKSGSKSFFSLTHKLLKDRENLILTPIEEIEANTVIELTEEPQKYTYPIDLQVKMLSHSTISRNPNTATLDFDKLHFPLKLRRWHNGDRFIPFNMTGFKKVSDFLIDTKVDMIKKENTWVILSGDEICWLVGHRVDHRFSVDKDTARVFEIRFTE